MYHGTNTAENACHYKKNTSCVHCGGTVLYRSKLCKGRTLLVLQRSFRGASARVRARQQWKSFNIYPMRESLAYRAKAATIKKHLALSSDSSAAMLQRNFYMLVFIFDLRHCGLLVKVNDIPHKLPRLFPPTIR